MSALKNPAVHDDLLNYRLKRLFNLGGAPAVRLCEGGFGITRQEWRLTAALVEGGSMGIGELAERSRVEPARVSRTVKDLVRKGLIERCKDAGDRRQAKLSATPRGHALYRELLPRLAQINRRLMEVLDDEEAALLESFLARLTRQAEKIYDEGGGVEEKTGRYLGTSRRTVRFTAGAGPG
jgi:DNA-binding MarR family transcriptional regulator